MKRRGRHGLTADHFPSPCATLCSRATLRRDVFLGSTRRITCNQEILPALPDSLWILLDPPRVADATCPRYPRDAHGNPTLHSQLLRPLERHRVSIRVLL